MTDRLKLNDNVDLGIDEPGLFIRHGSLATGIYLDKKDIQKLAAALNLWLDKGILQEKKLVWEATITDYTDKQFAEYTEDKTFLEVAHHFTRNYIGKLVALRLIEVDND